MFCVDLRRLQQRTGCSDVTCKDIIRTMSKYLRSDVHIPNSFRSTDKKLKKVAGASFIVLHACTGQDGKCKHVYKKQDNDTHCPSCGHARNPKPALRVFYFPIRDKLRALLKLPTYRKMIDFESTRSKNSAYLSDVYDSPAWQRFMGPCVIPNNRIGLQLCMDGIPAFSANTLSLKPAEFMVLSLPPAVRNKSQFMLLWMLLPTSAKGHTAKKFFDFAMSYEMNDMYDNGVSGVKVKVFGTSMDTPGRAELIGMEGHMTYTSCCVCKHCFSPPIPPRTKCCFDGYRRFLAIASRGRQRRVVYQGSVYEYRGVATRNKPEIRDDEFVRAAVAFAKQRRAAYLGHVSLPLLACLRGQQWYRLNIPDLMHGILFFTHTMHTHTQPSPQ